MNTFDLIHSIAESWARFMFYALLESTAVFAVIGLLWLALRNKTWVSAQFGYCLFLLVLLKLLVPGGISIPGLISFLFPPNQPAFEEGVVPGGWLWLWGEGEGGVEKPVAPGSPARSSDTTIRSPLPLTFPSVLMLGWLATVVPFLAKFFWVEWRTRRTLRKTIPLDLERITIDVERLQRIAGVKQPVQWVTGSWVNAPMAFGVLRPLIAVPPDISERYTPAQIRWILLHELAHIKRGDAIVSSLQKILQILFFFHPVVWWANSIINQQREYACDDTALTGSAADRKDCGEGFLSIVLQTNGLPTIMPATLGMINYKTMIRRRLMRILDDKRRLHSKLTFGAGILLLMVALFVAPFSFKKAVAQVEGWAQVSDTGPSGRGYPNLVYDTIRQVVLLHGGVSEIPNPQNFHDTWEWDGQTWTIVSTQGPAVFDPQMAYDIARGVAVLFGGNYWENNSASNIIDPYTWEWDSTERKWIQIDTSYMTPRAGGEMVYDPINKVSILHGGWNGNDYLSETWAWDGNSWNRLADGPKRHAHSMIYDSIREKIVLFGGWEGNLGEFPADSTWEYDVIQNKWTPVATQLEPPGRLYSAFSYDSNRRVATLYGGGEISLSIFGFPNDRPYSDTWEWDGENWTHISSDIPPARLASKMVYDPNHQKIVLFGGCPNWSVAYTGTWEYTAPSSSGIPKSLWSLY